MIRILLALKNLLASTEVYLRIIAFRGRYKGIPYSRYKYFYKNLLRANELRQYGVQFAEESDKLVATFQANSQQVKLIIHSANDLGLIELVFVHRNYNFIPSQPINAIDIGMNIGDTCLFFASNPLVNQVFGYELCEPTYNIALSNFSVNPAFSNKIVPNCYGLGARNETIQIPFHNDFLGANGVFETAGKHLFKSKGVLLDCQIKNVSEEFQKIGSTLPLLLKVDVEGSEYEIFRELDRTNSFKMVKYVMLEYHFGHQDIIEILFKNGFEVNEIFSSKNENISLGMIYASKSSLK